MPSKGVLSFLRSEKVPLGGILGHRLLEEVFAPVPHRQWVFTIPKRLRIYFRYDRKLLGKLCRAAWETIRDLYGREVDGDCGMPAMIAAVQTFGDLVNHHPHIHAVAIALEQPLQPALQRLVTAKWTSQGAERCFVSCCRQSGESL